jgi:pectin methylesterase-like acyl-CoA thioesterase
MALSSFDSLINTRMLLPFSTAALFGLLTLTAEARLSSTTPAQGALVVRQHNTRKGEYSSIAAAVVALGNASSKPATIFAYGGEYYEQVSLLLHRQRYERYLT